MLRGVQEEHNSIIMVSQVVRVPVDHSIYTAEVYYTEYISKNNLHI